MTDRLAGRHAGKQPPVAVVGMQWVTSTQVPPSILTGTSGARGGSAKLLNGRVSSSGSTRRRHGPEVTSTPAHDSRLTSTVWGSETPMQAGSPSTHGRQDGPASAVRTRPGGVGEG